MLISELPILTSVRELPRDTMQAVLDADRSAPSSDAVKNAHTFARASESVQERFFGARLPQGASTPLEC